MTAGTSEHPHPVSPPTGSHAAPLGAGDASESGLYVALKTDLNGRQQLKLELNEQFEIELGAQLEHHCVDIARRMAEVIGGFQDYAGAIEYIRQNLETRLVDWDQHQRDVQERIQLGLEGPPSIEVVGNEHDLLMLLQANYGDQHKGLYDYVYGLPANIEACRTKLGLLKSLKPLFDGHNPIRSGPDTPYTELQIFKQNRKLFRKVYFSLKLWEMLESQMGYFDGSLSFKGGVKTDLEYWVYLISTKTRSPKHQMLTNAPKSMKRYRTSEKTLLPIYNQPSLSKGHAEFVSARDFPLLVKAEIQSRLNQALAAPGGRERIKALAAGLRDEEVGDLDAVVGKIVDENKRKTFYTDILKLSWSDVKYDAGENPFAMSDYLAARLKPTDIKDERVYLEAVQSNLDVLERLRQTETRVNVVGRKANIMITPLSAIMEFAAKLNGLTTAELEILYAASLGERDARGPLIDRALQDGFEALQRWYLSALAAAKPIYSGPSGHALGYLNLYAKAYDRDEAIKAVLATDVGAGGRAGPRDKPTLEQARLVMLAALIGKKQHHTYDEVMVASHGIATQSDPRRDNTLSYRHAYSYADIAQSGDPIAVEAFAQARASVIAMAGANARYAGVLDEWKAGLDTDNCFPMIKDVPVYGEDVRIGAPVDLSKTRAQLTWKAVDQSPRSDGLLADEENLAAIAVSNGQLRTYCVDSPAALNTLLFDEIHTPFARGDGAVLDGGSYLDHVSCNADMASVVFLYERQQIAAAVPNAFTLTAEAKALLASGVQPFRQKYGDYFVAGTRKGGRLAIVVNLHRRDLDKFRASDWPAQFPTFGILADRIRRFVEACGEATIRVTQWGIGTQGRWYTVTKPDFYKALEVFASLVDGGSFSLDESIFADLVHYSQIAPNFPPPDAVDLPLAFDIRRLGFWIQLVPDLAGSATSPWTPDLTDKDQFLHDTSVRFRGHAAFMAGSALARPNIDFLQDDLMSVLQEVYRRRSLKRIAKLALERRGAAVPRNSAAEGGFSSPVDDGVLIDITDHQHILSLGGSPSSRMLVTDTVTVPADETIIGWRSAPDFPGLSLFTPDLDMIGSSSGVMRLEPKGSPDPQMTRWIVTYRSIRSINFKRL